ncbi:MAG: CBS domain-containing protein [Chloroflexota bacterium]
MMRREAPTVEPSSPVERLVYEHIMGTDEHAFPVMEDGELVGIVTLKDVRSLERDAWQRTSVREIMTSDDRCVVIEPEEDAANALTKLSTCDVHALPVVGDGELLGVLRRQDVIQWLRLHAETGGWGSRAIV